MDEPETLVAVELARSVAVSLGLPVDEAIVLRASNRYAVRLLPADTLARVMPSTHGAAQFEVEIALALAGTDAPVAELDPRVPPRVWSMDGFTITFWTHHAATVSDELAPDEYAEALLRLHAGLREVQVDAPHFTERVREAERIVTGSSTSAELSGGDRRMLLDVFAGASRSLRENPRDEQLLHGEPLPGNVLVTSEGPLFIDLETVCRGPVEFDLAHVPVDVADHYPGVDQARLLECRALVLAMVAAWRLEPGDQLPNRERALRELLAALRAGPPYPALASLSGPD